MQMFGGISLQHHLMAGAAVAAVAIASPAIAQTRQFNVPAQSAARGIPQFARQAGVQILASGNAVAGRRTNAVRGNYSVEEGLRALLQGTGLSADAANAGGIITVRAVAPGEAPAAGAAADNEGVDQHIIVTGSYIPGANGGASAVERFTREEIERTGFSTVGQFLQTLPQNSGGEANENSAVGRAAPNGNFALGGTGANLRGLGNLSTLTLLNGMRLAPSGRGSYVDVSAIPSSAIERIEILTDGASAIYGSDAVAGVVNIILRDDFEGAETRLRYLDGDAFAEREFAQTAGARWSSGQVLATYDFRRATGLDANARDYARDAPDPLFLVPESRSHTLLVAGRQEVSSLLNLQGQGFYNRRNFEQSTNFGVGSPQRAKGNVEQYLASLNAHLDLAEHWSGELVGLTSRSRTHVTTRFGTTSTSESRATSRNYELQAIATGPLFRLPAGNVRMAIGGQYERSSYIERTFKTADAHRDRWTAFAELLIPLVAEAQEVDGIDELTLSVAGRYDHYSDFGSTTNPKIGVIWRPIRSLRLRASYGTSFRVPTFDQLNDALNQAFPFRLADPTAPGGTTATIILSGANAGLQPETATTWSAGFDAHAGFLGDVTVSASYWDIDYTDRIITPTTNVVTALRDEALFGELVIRNPTAALVQQITTSPNFVNPLNIPVSQIGAIFDDRLQNVAADRLNGIDFRIAGQWPLGSVDLFATAAGQYILNFERQQLPATPPADIVDTVFNPSDFRLRFDGGIRAGGLTLSAAVNYTDSYSDTRVIPNLRVDSWTTVDLGASYAFGDAAPPWLRGFVFSANVVNAFDQNPPFIQRSVASQIHFDGANANALGRFVTFVVTKRW